MVRLLTFLTKKQNEFLSLFLLQLPLVVEPQESKLYSIYSCHDYYSDYALFLVHNQWNYESGKDSTAYMYVAGGYIENVFFRRKEDTLCLFPQSVLQSIDVSDFIKLDTCMFYKEYIQSLDYEYKHNSYWMLLDKGDSLSLIKDSINCRDFNGSNRFPTLHKLQTIPLKQTEEEKNISNFRNRFSL